MNRLKKNIAIKMPGPLQTLIELLISFKKVLPNLNLTESKQNPPRLLNSMGLLNTLLSEDQKSKSSHAAQYSFFNPRLAIYEFKCFSVFLMTDESKQLANAIIDALKACVSEDGHPFIEMSPYEVGSLPEEVVAKLRKIHTYEINEFRLNFQRFISMYEFPSMPFPKYIKDALNRLQLAATLFHSDASFDLWLDYNHTKKHALLRSKGDIEFLRFAFSYNKPQQFLKFLKKFGAQLEETGIWNKNPESWLRTRDQIRKYYEAGIPENFGWPSNFNSIVIPSELDEEAKAFYE